VAAPLRKLSFIQFARWAIVRRWPTDRSTRRDHAAPRALLFLTNFDGSSIQYIEAFVRVVPWRIRALYAGAKGFSGARRFGPVERYIYDHSHPVDHFWMAHPEATTTMVRQALELKTAYDAFEPRVAGADAESFGRDGRRFLTEVQDLL
jgi:hypothetical protein